MGIKFRYINNDNSDKVICDTNIWYRIAAKEFSISEVEPLTATSFSLEELATSPNQVKAIKYHQEIIKVVYAYSEPILALNPLDFILNNHNNQIPVNETRIQVILTAFAKVMERNIPDNVQFNEEERDAILTQIRAERFAKKDFANYSNKLANKIQNQLNRGYKRKAHEKEDAYELNKAFLKLILEEHANSRGYDVSFESFNWDNVELFLIVTGHYFNKLETTSNMKVQENDIVDWFNLLYVRPNDKYFTLDQRWKDLILNDDRTKDYYYVK